MPFPNVSVADLESRYKDIPADDEPRVQVWLDDASRIIRRYIPDIDERTSIIPPETEPEIDPELVTQIVCQMVIRKLQNPEGLTGGTQLAGPFMLVRNQGTEAVNGLFLTKVEKKLLGLSVGAGSFPHYYDGLETAEVLG